MIIKDQERLRAEMSRTTMVLCFFLVVSVLATSSGCCPLDADEVREQLTVELRVGDSREKIEIVLRNAGIDFSYDKWTNSYGATIRDDEHCGPLSMYKAISVYIHLDDTGHLSRIEVSDSYTWW